MDEKFDSRPLFINISQFSRSSAWPLPLPDGRKIVRPLSLSSSEFVASNNRACLVRQDQSDSTASQYERSTREMSDIQGIATSFCSAKDLQHHFRFKHKDAMKRLGSNLLFAIYLLFSIILTLPWDAGLLFCGSNRRIQFSYFSFLCSSHTQFTYLWFATNSAIELLRRIDCSGQCSISLIYVFLFICIYLFHLSLSAITMWSILVSLPWL